MNEKNFKVIFAGDLEVGKTSFIIKYTQNKFSQTYKATLGSKSNWNGTVLKHYVSVDCVAQEVRRTPTDIVRVSVS